MFSPPIDCTRVPNCEIFSCTQHTWVYLLMALGLWRTRAWIHESGLPWNKAGGLFHLSNATLFLGGRGGCSIPPANASKITCLASQKMSESKNNMARKEFHPSRDKNSLSSSHLFLSPKNTLQFTLVSKEGKSSLRLREYNHLPNCGKTVPLVSC